MGAEPERGAVNETIALVNTHQTTPRLSRNKELTQERTRKGSRRLPNTPTFGSGLRVSPQFTESVSGVVNGTAGGNFPDATVAEEEERDKQNEYQALEGSAIAIRHDETKK